MGIERYTAEEAKKLPSRSDTERLKNMTEEDIERAAEDDPDNPPLTDEELKGFQPGEHRGGGAYGPKKSKR